jgi:hypothetical protein
LQPPREVAAIDAVAADEIMRLRMKARENRTIAIRCVRDLSRDHVSSFPRIFLDGLPQRDSRQTETGSGARSNMAVTRHVLN